MILKNEFEANKKIKKFQIFLKMPLKYKIKQRYLESFQRIYL
jgi:hypothetical protein